MDKEKRDTRLISKYHFDDPNEFLEAGSGEEYDQLCEWDRGDLVEKIQDLDEENFQLSAKIKARDLLLEEANNRIKFYVEELNSALKRLEGDK